MRTRFRTHLAVLGGAVVCFLAAGATPTSAAMEACPAGTPAYFTGAAVYLGQEPDSNIWSSPVTLTAYCGRIDPDHVLTGVAVTGVLASSTGAIPQLYASANGNTPDTLLPENSVPGLPFPGAVLQTPPGLRTDSEGHATFTLRAYSPVQPFLAGPDGAPQLIGLQLDMGVGTGITHTGETFPVPVGGYGGIFAATPELDSLALFGSGAVGMAGYALTRFRARRRRD
jgi:hypothetical protein